MKILQDFKSETAGSKVNICLQMDLYEEKPCNLSPKLPKNTHIVTKVGDEKNSKKDRRHTLTGDIFIFL